MKICVFGAASAHIDDKYIKETEALGERLAKRGHSLVYGAGATGLMGAAARGFKRGGGRIFGVIPEFFRDESIEQIYTGCDELRYTKTMSERKMIMEDNADAFVILPGGVGTFEEFYEVLTLKQLGRHGKAMVIYNIDGFYAEMQEFLKTVVNKKFITFELDDMYACVDSADALIKYLDGYEPTVKLCKRDPLE